MLPVRACRGGPFTRLLQAPLLSCDPTRCAPGTARWEVVVVGGLGVVLMISMVLVLVLVYGVGVLVIDGNSMEQ